MITPVSSEWHVLPVDVQEKIFRNINKLEDIAKLSLVAKDFLKPDGWDNHIVWRTLCSSLNKMNLEFAKLQGNQGVSKTNNNSSDCSCIKPETSIKQIGINALDYFGIKPESSFGQICTSALDNLDVKPSCRQTFNSAYNRKDTKALLCLARMYEESNIIEQNLRKAFKLYVLILNQYFIPGCDRNRCDLRYYQLMSGYPGVFKVEQAEYNLYFTILSNIIADKNTYPVDKVIAKLELVGMTMHKFSSLRLSNDQMIEFLISISEDKDAPAIERNRADLWLHCYFDIKRYDLLFHHIDSEDISPCEKAQTKFILAEQWFHDTIDLTVDEVDQLMISLIEDKNIDPSDKDHLLLRRVSLYLSDLTKSFTDKELYELLLSKSQDQNVKPILRVWFDFYRASMGFNNKTNMLTDEEICKLLQSISQRTETECQFIAESQLILALMSCQGRTDILSMQETADLLLTLSKDERLPVKEKAKAALHRAMLHIEGKICLSETEVTTLLMQVFKNPESTLEDQKLAQELLHKLQT